MGACLQNKGSRLLGRPGENAWLPLPGTTGPTRVGAEKWPCPWTPEWSKEPMGSCREDHQHCGPGKGADQITPQTLDAVQCEPLWTKTPPPICPYEPGLGVKCFLSSGQQYPGPPSSESSPRPAFPFSHATRHFLCTSFPLHFSSIPCSFFDHTL